MFYLCKRTRKTYRSKTRASGKGFHTDASDVFGDIDAQEARAIVECVASNMFNTFGYVNFFERSTIRECRITDFSDLIM